MYKIDKPVIFNYWKHHFNFLLNESYKLCSQLRMADLISHLDSLGGSQFDVYEGSLSPLEISNEVANILRNNGHFYRKNYEGWIKKEEKKYQMVTLSDKSIWTLRIGDDPEYYVHIHPGRYSKHTFRARAMLMRTAVLSACYAKAHNRDPYDLELINYVRDNYMFEQPVKNINKENGLGKLIIKITSHLSLMSHNI